MFENILVPIDQSSLAECVLPHVVAIAGAFESQVILLHVMDSANQSGQSYAIDPIDWQIRKAEAENYMHGLALRLHEAGLPTERHILEGQGAERILDFADNNDVNLIVLSSHGQSGLSGWDMSSVIQKIILHARTSIMVVRAYQPALPQLPGLLYRRILIPLDGSQRAECVLSQAASLARTHQAQMVLAHIVRRPEMPRRTPPTFEDVELADQVVERNRVEAVEYLDQLKSHLPGDVQASVTISEHVDSTLHELVGQEKIDLVVLSAHGYSGQTRWPYGSTVTSFIAYGTTPLLIVQDVPAGGLQSTPAQMAAQEQGRR